MAVSAQDRLLGIRLKIERAKYHVNDLERRLLAFRETDPYTALADANPQPGEQFRNVKLHILAKLPTEVPLIAGEILYQLRSALDHLAWQLVEANGGKPGKHTYFPISEDAAAYKANSPGKVKGIHPDAIHIIDSIKPYQGGNDHLWIIHKLNNIDKHNFVLVTAFGHLDAIVTISPTLYFGGTIPNIETFDTGMPDNRFAILQDGAVIGRIENNADGIAQSDDDVQFHVGFEVTFGQLAVVEGEPVVDCLKQLLQVVDGIVNQFVPFLSHVSSPSSLERR